METPLLKGAGAEEDETLPSYDSSTGNERDVSTGNEREVSTGNEEEVSTGNEQEVSTTSEQDDTFGSKEDVSPAASTNQGQAAPPKQLKTASPKEGKDASIWDQPAGKVKDPAQKHNSKTKKNISQGLLNLALLTANASQLRAALDGRNSHPYFCLVVVLISISMVLQIVAGALQIYVAKLDVDKDKPREKCNRVNIAVAILVFLVAAFEAMIPVFGPQPSI